MRLKTSQDQGLLRLYTYPVLGDGLSFSSGEFKSSIDIKQIGEDICVLGKSSLSNSTLEKLIKEGKASFLYHFECPQTCYRQVLLTDKVSIEKHFKKGELEGTFEICTFIVAVKDISNYENEDFSLDYTGLSFQISEGNVLAVGNEFQFRINKKHADLGYTESIFSIIPNKDGKDKSLLQLDYVGDKIIIAIPEKQYALFEHLQEQSSKQSLFISMIIIPALLSVLTALELDGIDDYQDKRWFRSLSEKCMEYNIDLSEKIDDSIEPFELVQKLLDYPITKSIDEIAIGNGDEDNED